MTWTQRNEWARSKGYKNMYHYRKENHLEYYKREQERLKVHNASVSSKKRNYERMKLKQENLTDYYVRRVIIRSNPEFKNIEIPADFLELYRNQIKLKRLIKNGT